MHLVDVSAQGRVPQQHCDLHGQRGGSRQASSIVGRWWPGAQGAACLPCSTADGWGMKELRCTEQLAEGSSSSRQDAQHAPSAPSQRGTAAASHLAHALLACQAHPHRSAEGAPSKHHNLVDPLNCVALLFRPAVHGWRFGQAGEGIRALLSAGRVTCPMLGAVQCDAALAGGKLISWWQPAAALQDLHPAAFAAASAAAAALHSCHCMHDGCCFSVQHHHS